MATHASWLELVYLVVATAGTMSAALTFFASRSDYFRKLAKTGAYPPIRLWMLKAVYASSKTTLFINVWILGNAVWGVTHAPPPPAPSQQSIGNVISWIVIVSVLTVAQVRALYWRRQLSEGDFGGPATLGRRATDRD